MFLPANKPGRIFLLNSAGGAIACQRVCAEDNAVLRLLLFTTTPWARLPQPTKTDPVLFSQLDVLVVLNQFVTSNIGYHTPSLSIALIFSA